MALFEVIGAGFDGGTDDTDDRVIWVSAPSADVVAECIADTGAELAGTVDADAAPDYELPAQRLQLGAALLQMASDARNFARIP